MYQKIHNPNHRNRDIQSIPTVLQGPSLREEPTLLPKLQRTRLSLHHYLQLYLLLAESGCASPSLAAATSAEGACPLHARGSTCFETNERGGTYSHRRRGALMSGRLGPPLLCWLQEGPRRRPCVLAPQCMWVQEPLTSSVDWESMVQAWSEAFRASR